MATGIGSNTSYNFEEVPASGLSRHCISFNPRVVNSMWDMTSNGNQYGMNSLSSVVMPSSSNSAVLSDSGLSQGGTSSGSYAPDGTLGLKHDTGLAVEWSVKEQYMLERSLDKYKNESTIMKYIKIAVALPDKTVRDVALRCRWMSRKRRKHVDHHSGKKVTNRKEISEESFPTKPVLPSVQALNISVTHSPLMHQLGMSGLAPSDASCEAVKQYLQQNVEAFDQISNNMSSYKLQENTELFFRTKNNITRVLNEMGSLPGLPDLPVSINEDLINSPVPYRNQHLHTPDELIKYTHLKQDART